MTDDIAEPSTCTLCGGDVKPPLDHQWRWARGSKTFDTFETAQARADRLNRSTRQPYEFRAALDRRGMPRIASRRTA